jgi:hypothetical protein
MHGGVQMSRVPRWCKQRIIRHREDSTSSYSGGVGNFDFEFSTSIKHNDQAT